MLQPVVGVLSSFTPFLFLPPTGWLVWHYCVQVMISEKCSLSWFLLPPPKILLTCEFGFISHPVFLNTVFSLPYTQCEPPDLFITCTCMHSHWFSLLYWWSFASTFPWITGARPRLKFRMKRQRLQDTRVAWCWQNKRETRSVASSTCPQLGFPNSSFIKNLSFLNFLEPSNIKVFQLFKQIYK